MIFKGIPMMSLLLVVAAGGSACVNQQTGEPDFSFLMLPIITIEEYSKVPGYMAGGTVHDPHAIKVGNGQTIYVSPHQLNSSSIAIIHNGR